MIGSRGASVIWQSSRAAGYALGRSYDPDGFAAENRGAAGGIEAVGHALVGLQAVCVDEDGLPAGVATPGEPSDLGFAGALLHYLDIEINRLHIQIAGYESFAIDRGAQCASSHTTALSPA